MGPNLLFHHKGAFQDAGGASQGSHPSGKFARHAQVACRMNPGRFPLQSDVSGRARGEPRTQGLHRQEKPIGHAQVVRRVTPDWHATAEGRAG